MYQFTMLCTLFITSLSLHAKQQVDYREVYQHTLKEERAFLLKIRNQKTDDTSEVTIKTTDHMPSLHSLQKTYRDRQLDRRTDLLRKIAMF